MIAIDAPITMSHFMACSIECAKASNPAIAVTFDGASIPAYGCTEDVPVTFSATSIATRTGIANWATVSIDLRSLGSAPSPSSRNAIRARARRAAADRRSPGPRESSRTYAQRIVKSDGAVTVWPWRNSYQLEPTSAMRSWAARGLKEGTSPLKPRRGFPGSVRLLSVLSSRRGGRTTRSPWHRPSSSPIGAIPVARRA